MFWPDKGVIVGNLNEGPQYKVNTESTPKDFDGQPWDKSADKIPQLSQWSDIVYLTWKQVTSEEQRPKLQAICRRAISNSETKNMLARVLQKNFKKDPVAGTGRAPKWPEFKKITPDMYGFNALLYTPNIRGIVWLLIQHHDLIGKKTIESITVSPKQSCRP